MEPDFRDIPFPKPPDPRRDWVFILTWTAMAAAEFAIVYRVVGFIVEAAR